MSKGGSWSQAFLAETMETALFCEESLERLMQKMQLLIGAVLVVLIK